jgi:hypothetical protein
MIRDTKTKARTLEVGGLEFTAERVEWFCTLRNHFIDSPVAGYSWKPGWRLLIGGAEVWDGAPGKCSTSSQSPTYSSFNKLAAAVAESQGTPSGRYVFWKTVEYATGQDMSGHYKPLKEHT